MADARTVIADNVRAILLVAGIGLVILGGVGSDPVGVVSIVGIVTVLSAVFLASPIERVLRDEEGDEEVSDPVSDLRDRYVDGEMGEEEFERRMEELLSSEEGGGDSGEERVEVASSPVRESE